MTETTSNPSFFPAERGPGHGLWKRSGRRSFEAATIAFVTLGGALVRTQTVTQEIEIGENPDTFTSEAKIQFADPEGKPVMNGCATATGQRFDPLTELRDDLDADRDQH